MIRRLQSVCATAAGTAPRREELAREALPLAGELPERARPRVVGDRRGARRRRRSRGADEAFREAIALLAEHGSVREHAGVLRSYGRYLRDAGREREALDVFERAAEVASNLQAEPASASGSASAHCGGRAERAAVAGRSDELWRRIDETGTDTRPAAA